MAPSLTCFAVNPMPTEMPSQVLFGSWVPSVRMSDAWRIWLRMPSTVEPLHRLESKAPTIFCS